MSSIDLTEAVEAAASARLSRGGLRLRWEDAPELFRDRVRATVCVDDITAALPHIERQMREQVARELRLMRRRVRDGRMPAGAERDGYLIALDDAARRIARGES